MLKVGFAKAVVPKIKIKKEKLEKGIYLTQENRDPSLVHDQKQERTRRQDVVESINWTIVYYRMDLVCSIYHMRKESMRMDISNIQKISIHQFNAKIIKERNNSLS